MINPHKEIRRSQMKGVCNCGYCLPRWGKDSTSIYRSTRRILKYNDRIAMQKWDND